MILKLLKYELKHMWKLKCMVFIMMLVLCTLFAGLVKGVNTIFGDEGLAVTSTVAPLYYIFFVQFALVLLAAMAVLSIVRFVKSLLGSEAYLMRSLPVSIHSQLITQIVSTVLWIGTSIMVVVASEVIMNLVTQDYIGGIAGLFFAINEGIYAVVNSVMFIYICLHIYACLSVGFSFENGKMAISIALYAFTSFAEWGIGLLVLPDLLKRYTWLTHETASICFCGLFGFLYYWVTVYFLKNELNVE